MEAKSKIHYEQLKALFHFDVSHFIDMKNLIGIQMLFTDSLQFKNMLSEFATLTSSNVKEPQEERML